MNLLTPEGQRWDCHACGACCHLYELGPVEVEVVRDLERRQIEGHWAPAKDGWYERRRAADGRAAYFLTHRDGHCVFLMPDRRCAVHAAFGEAAKPGFCREYPFHLAQRGDGLAVVVRPSCQSHHRGATPLADQAPAAAALPRAMSVRRADPPAIAVEPGILLPEAQVVDVERALLAAVPTTGETRVTAQRRTVRAFVAGTDTPPDPERARLATGAIVEGVRRLMAHAAGDDDADPHRRAFAAESERLLAAALPRLGGAASGPAGAPLDAYLADLTASFLLARWYLGLGGLAQGLGFLAVQASLAATAPDLDAAAALVARWTRLTENAAVLGLLRRAEPALLDVYRYG